MKEIETQIGRKEYLPDGSIVESRIINPLILADNYSDTAYHEALHAATAPRKVEMVSIVPGPGYLGITKFSSFDAAAAAAPHAHGKSGTSWDTTLIAMQGGSVSGASAEAKSRLAGKGEHVEAVARRLEVVKSMSGGEVREIMRRVDVGEEVEITITSASGEKEIKTEEGVRGEIIIVDFTNISEKADSNEEEIDVNIIKFPEKTQEIQESELPLDKAA